MKTLGILGGMSPESTVSYYLNINRAVNATLGENHSANLLMSSVNFEDIVQWQKSANWQKAGEILSTMPKTAWYHPAFDEAKQNGYIGILALVLENGDMVLEQDKLVTMVIFSR